MAASRDEVRRLIGDLDDVLIDRVIAVGASEAELREAIAWLEGDEEIEAQLGEPTSPRVSKLVGLLQIMQEEDLDDDLVAGPH